MRIVVDTNILFSFFWAKSFTKKIIENSKFELISPEIAVKEINKYKNEIKDKVNCNEKEFIASLSNLKKAVKFIDGGEYSSFISEAEKFSPDKKDADFLALCLKERTFLWSNDSILKVQDRINVFSTEELIELILD